ncbi:MAG: cysteine desulfurase [Chloroflexi bacterium]|nr:cysteine desulfurase [Chloroflexota bacterium]
MAARRDVYLDHSASTPVDPRVLEAMAPYFSEVYGNSSSSHSYGRKAEAAIERAREKVSSVLRCKSSEIVFTSGGSESDNLAIRGAAWTARAQGKGTHLVTTPVEHSAVTATVKQLAAMQGFGMKLIPVSRTGQVDVEDFVSTLTAETTVASVIYANNEIGTIAPIPQLAEAARDRGVVFHTDAVQAAGQLSLDVNVLGVDMMSLSAHKFYGPKGVGALYVREGVELSPAQSGGSHERGLRAGTHNTPFIVGMAEALRIAYEEHADRVEHLRRCRDAIIDRVLAEVPDSILTGEHEHRLPSHASFVFPGVDSSQLLMHLDMRGVAASGGSACKTGSPEPSSVLLALGLSEDEAIGSLRLSVGVHTTLDDVEYAVGAVKESVSRLRSLPSHLRSARVS